MAYTVSPPTAGVEADSAPSLRLHMSLPVYLLIACNTPSSPSWKMRFPIITGGNSSSAEPPWVHTVLYGGRMWVEAGKKRVWFFVYPYNGHAKLSTPLTFGRVGVGCGTNAAWG